jgi:hypothetical protein
MSTPPGSACTAAYSDFLASSLGRQAPQVFDLGPSGSVMALPTGEHPGLREVFEVAAGRYGVAAAPTWLR